MDREYWDDHRGATPMAIELDDGTVLYPSADPEGNGPGALFGYDPDAGDDCLFRYDAPEDVE